VLEEVVEDVTDVVDELVDVGVEVAVVGGDHGEAGLVEEHEPGEVHRADRVQGRDHRVPVPGQRLQVPELRLQGPVVVGRPDEHDQRERVLDLVVSSGHRGHLRRPSRRDGPSG
jgi:hypothetical protein